VGHKDWKKTTILILTAWVGRGFFFLSFLSPLLATCDDFVRMLIHFLGFGLFMGVGVGSFGIGFPLVFFSCFFSLSLYG